VQAGFGAREINQDKDPNIREIGCRANIERRVYYIIVHAGFAIQFEAKRERGREREKKATDTNIPEIGCLVSG
jgi:hypothetical protein